MKVVHLIDHLGAGGSQSILLDLAEGRSPGTEIEAWTLSSRTESRAEIRLREAGVKRENFALERTGPLGLLRLRSRLRTAAPDVVDLHLDVTHSLGTACAVGLRPRPVLVLRLENVPSAQYALPWRVGLRAAATRVDTCLAMSRSLVRSAPEIAARAPRVDVIEPGIDIGRFEGYRPSAADLKSLRGGASALVGSVGRLVRQKGYDRLIEAMPRLTAERPGLRLVIAGEGPERRALEALASALGVSHAVRLVGHLEDPRALFAAMDLFVLPSRHEGYGIVLLEAMAMGVPVVAPRVVGCRDAIRDRETGILVPPDDVAALWRSISALLADPEHRGALAGRARAWLRTHGSRRRMVERTEAVYRELLAGRAESRATRNGGSR